MSENMVFRRIFGPIRDEITGEWRKLHNEELNDLYSSPNIVRMIKLRRTRWAGHVVRVWRGGPNTGFWWENLKVRDHSEDPSVDGGVIIRWIFKKWELGVWTGSRWLRIGKRASTCECCNEPLDSIKFGVFID